jgi:hypothetical protein
MIFIIISIFISTFRFRLRFFARIQLFLEKKNDLLKLKTLTMKYIKINKNFCIFHKECKKGTKMNEQTIITTVL